MRAGAGPPRHGYRLRHRRADRAGRSDDFADALAGAPLAKRLNAPILRTHSTQAASETLAKARRMQVAVTRQACS